MFFAFKSYNYQLAIFNFTNNYLMEAINFTAYTNDSSQIDAIKAVLKALKIKFDMAKEKPYNAEFVSKIEESREQYKKGKYAVIKTEDLWK
jgi:hypothetical protein